MQPYFFPYLGYFHLIDVTDRWVVFDTVQYIRHGWMNRNRILHPEEGWLYFIVPLKKHSRDTSIRDVRIKEGDAWKERIIGQIQHYKKRAPYFRDVEELLRDCLFGTQTSSLVDLNVRCLEKTCHFIGISFTHEVFSEMHLSLGEISGPGDWALEISKSLGAQTYVNPAGGAEIFDAERFEAAGIALEFRLLPPMEYAPRASDFEPNLSIIDVLMWNSASDVRRYLLEHRVS